MVLLKLCLLLDEEFGNGLMMAENLAVGVPFDGDSQTVTGIKHYLFLPNQSYNQEMWKMVVL